MTAIAFRSRNIWPFIIAAALAACTAEKGNPLPLPTPPPPATPPPDPNKTAGDKTFDQGQQIFRFDTFGDEAFWGAGGLRIHETLRSVTPAQALGVGLKVDSDALDAATIAAIKAGQVNVNDKAVTQTLLKANAVVGVKGTFDSTGTLSNVGITCAVCHSTVDNSVTTGIGKRLDGWPNRDLNVGAVISLAPQGALAPVAALLSLGPLTVDEATVRTVLASWGPGKFDAELFLDEKFQNPELPGNPPSATLIPAAFGLRGVNLHTYTGWGSIPQWNAFVAVLEMHGVGNYMDARLDDPKFPIAKAAGMGHHTVPPAQDQVSSKLGPLEFYQLALEPPTPPAGSFDAAAAARGKTVFEGSGKCATCHVAPLYTDAGWNMHTGAEIGIEEFQATRSPDNRYRTTPLRGLFTRATGGFYHDGRFKGADFTASLNAVVDHYRNDPQTPSLGITITPAQQSDLVEYLKSL